MMSRPAIARGRVELGALAAATVILTVLRGYASACVGFGDSEALYAAYALHPQPAYLDHPGLIGLAARAIGGGTAPSPERAHAVTSLLALLVPWAMASACRASGAPWRRALAAGFVVALVPEMSIGLFAMTPDLLLSLSWIGALGFAAWALTAPPGSRRSFIGFSAAGLLAGVAAASKASGALLMIALAVTYASRSARAHAKSIAPWAGWAAGACVTAPVVGFEARSGWPMLQHRLIDTQSAAGLSLLNVGALVGGQIAYLSPVVAILVVGAARALWRGRTGGPVGRLLFNACAIPATALLPLCLWSRVAEPHWLAPALLALAPAAARAELIPSRRSVIAACAVAGTMTAVVFAWVLTPSSARLFPASYQALDLSRELYGWPETVRAVRELVAAARRSTSVRGDVVVVGPHWVICAQLDAALRGEVPVGCNSPLRDDFDGWWPRRRWRSSDTIVWVTDARFGMPPPLASHFIVSARPVTIERGGRVIRRFVILTLTRRDEA
jgi:hypothetical protein